MIWMLMGFILFTGQSSTVCILQFLIIRAFRINSRWVGNSGERNTAFVVMDRTPLRPHIANPSYCYLCHIDQLRGAARDVVDVAQPSFEEPPLMTYLWCSVLV
ncbi:hypothetical protein BDN70DRAFT_692498 [Pholiota conissans]|uniref:Uncharacterized protein n=1 Tax=Pholiota conissans TaxID=109636 RepID=A0A9P6D183_9AGAR|nr:hypothetical protein BDN70DRAFT_692498 [Pholiota conissans]